jgi:hypothetical protein
MLVGNFENLPQKIVTLAEIAIIESRNLVFSGMPNHYNRYCRAHGHLAKACPLEKAK